MWQNRLCPCAVFTETSEGFSPHYLAEIRHDMRQTTIRLRIQRILWIVVDRFLQDDARM